jgi:purine-binding chemotaxis protein CheW
LIRKKNPHRGSQAEEEDTMSVQQGSNRQETCDGGKFLTFYLDGEEYGLEILTVQEIIGMMDVTPVPRTAAYVRGVINLRGKVIPIVDLRLKFDMPAAERTAETCIIVVQTRRVQTGIVVDQVSEVLDIPSGNIEAPPAFGGDVRTDYILGIGKCEGRVRLLLDIDRVLSEGGLEGLAGGDGLFDGEATGDKEILEPAGGRRS